MQRCIELAKKGAGFVAPNPMVGAVLAYNGRIIGEGWHQRYGESHAEVNCIASVEEEDKNLISASTLYVSLEPCSHFGKTPPCANHIISWSIPRVVIGCRDPFNQVNGKGIEKLEAAGVLVEVGLLEQECREMNRRFLVFHTQHRPYVVLKWAQTMDGCMGFAPEGGSLNSVAKRLFISNEYSNRLVHRWRSEEASILVGTTTALLDDPELTARLWPGESPVRLVVDMDLKLPSSWKIFNRQTPTIIFNTKQHSGELGDAARPGLMYYQVIHAVSLVPQLLNALYQLNIQSVLVEGGATLLQSFIDVGVWDEARVITNEELTLGRVRDNNKLDAPVLNKSKMVFQQKILSDKIEIFKPENSALPTPDS